MKKNGHYKNNISDESVFSDIQFPLKMIENNPNQFSENKEEKEKGKAEQSLMFELKNISPFRLYYHISGKFEIFLMIAGIIFTIGAGCNNSILSLLLGNTLNDFTDSNEIKDLPDNEYKEIN